LVQQLPTVTTATPDPRVIIEATTVRHKVRHMFNEARIAANLIAIEGQVAGPSASAPRSLTPMDDGHVTVKRS
jgi:hypothetical protein